MPDHSLPQSDVFDLLRAERLYQEAKWTTANQSSLGDWLLVMDGKLREAVGLWHTQDVGALSKVMFLAAVAVACVERLGGPMVDAWIRDMEFQRTNCGYMSPSERAKRWYPVLEAIQVRRAAEEEAKRVAEITDEVSQSIQEV